MSHSWASGKPGAHLSSALRLVTPSLSSLCTCASFSACGLVPAAVTHAGQESDQHVAWFLQL